MVAAAQLETVLFRGLHEHVRDMIMVIDAGTGRIVEANRAAEAAYGYSRGELLALTVFDLRADPPAEVAEQMRIADRSGILLETVHRRRDGSLFPVEVSARGETLGDRRLLFSIVRDITDRRAAERERERLLAASQQALASRDDFLWVASHELRTPLAVASLQVQQLRRLAERDGGDPRLARAASAAREQLDRLNSLVLSLLDASQITAGSFALHREDVDLAVLARDVIDRLQTQAAQSGTRLALDARPIRGRWDRLRLDQVLTNLIGNALKYGAGRPVEVIGRGDGELARLEVRDQGIGVSAADADRIFNKFERAVPPAHYRGLGLGLYISRQIVEAHGGSIEVDTALGAGSTFRVVLPKTAP